MTHNDKKHSDSKPPKGSDTLSIFERIHATKPKTPKPSKEIQLMLNNINNRLQDYTTDKINELSSKENYEQLLNLIDQLNTDMESLNIYLQKNLNPKDIEAIQNTQNSINILMKLIENCIE